MDDSHGRTYYILKNWLTLLKASNFTPLDSKNSLVSWTICVSPKANRTAAWLSVSIYQQK